jgi:hypothetical protein
MVHSNSTDTPSSTFDLFYAWPCNDAFILLQAHVLHMTHRFYRLSIWNVLHFFYWLSIWNLLHCFYWLSIWNLLHCFYWLSIWNLLHCFYWLSIWNLLHCFYWLSIWNLMYCFFSIGYWSETKRRSIRGKLFCIRSISKWKLYMIMESEVKSQKQVLEGNHRHIS